MVTRIVLIRHASTETDGQLCGAFDVPLSSRGEAQLEALVGRPPTQDAPDALGTSTSRRARAVAAALGRAWALQPEAAEWAREIDCGDVEGMPLEQLQREWPGLWMRNEAQADETFAWPGGESYGQFRARVLDGLRATAAAHAGGRVAVVTHAGVISQALGVIRGRAASVWAADRPDPLTATEICTSRSNPAGSCLTTSCRGIEPCVSGTETCARATFDSSPPVKGCTATRRTAAGTHHRREMNAATCETIRRCYREPEQPRDKSRAPGERPPVGVQPSDIRVY